MSNGREAAENIKREQAERERQKAEAADEAAKLSAGIRPFWDRLNNILKRDIGDFRTGLKPRADQLKGEVLNDNNFTVLLAGLKLLEVVLEQESRIESEFTDSSGTKSVRKFNFSFDRQRGVTLSGLALEESANEILAPVYESFR